MIRALRSTDFRLLWISQSISMLGDALIMVALGLYVTRLTGRASDVGLVLAAYAVPLVVFVLVGGVLADRLPRPVVMTISDVCRCLLHALLALLILMGAVRVWHMVVIGLLFGTAEAFFRPAYTGLVPQTVPEEDIQAAQALGGLSFELASFASPVLATALVLGVNPAAAFGFDAVTFAVSATLLWFVRPRPRGEPGVAASDGPASFWTELKEGAQAVRDRPWVAATIVSFAAMLLLALAPFLVLGAEISRDVYGSEAVYGLGNAAVGIGTVTGALVGARWQPRFPMRAAMLGAIGWPASMAVFALGLPVGLLYPVLAAAGAGVGMFGVFWETALARRIPPHLLSRVSAWDWMGSLALLPLGYVIAGPLASVFGAIHVLLVGGLLGTLALIAGLIPRETRLLAALPPEPPSTGPGGPDRSSVPPAARDQPLAPL